MKKICFITTIPLTLNAFVVKTAAYIHENTDWDISFICRYDDEFAKSLPDYIHFIPVQMERGIRLSGVKAMLEINKIFKREKFDLIQYSTPNASLYASMAGKLAHIPVRLYCQWGMAFVGFQGIKRKIFQMEEKFVCSLSTHVEPDSNSNLHFAHKIGLYPESKGTVIWNGSACGVNLEKFDITKKEEYRNQIREQFGISKESFVYGFVGRVTRDKGVNELLRCFNEISTENDNAYLMMVGPSEVDETIDYSLYKWSVDSDKVIYVGYTDVVEQYLSAMDCYILPSYREGFGMGVVEAEAMGLPVIVTDIPGPIDAMIDDQTGIIVKKADTKTLTDAMLKLYGDRNLSDELANNGILLAKEKFEQKKFFEHVVKDRKQLLKED